jgi:hypothetical protein
MDERLISFQALRRARSTIEDFVLSYFPYHELDVSKVAILCAARAAALPRPPAAAMRRR